MRDIRGIFIGLRDFFGKRPDKPAEGPAPSKASAGSKVQVAPIGGHWGILCDTQEEVMNLGMNAVAKGEQVSAAPMNGKKAFGFILSEGGLKVVGIAEEIGRILTFYPMAEGIAHRATFGRAFPEPESFEGMIETTVGPAKFTVFDPLYFENHAAYLAEKCFRMAIFGIAYRITRAGDEKVKDRDGRELSMKGMAGFFPVREAPDDYSFRSTVKAVERLEANGKPILRLTTPLFRIPNEKGDYEDVDIYLYARQDRLNGYMPAKGEDIQGVMWLQGYMVN